MSTAFPNHSVKVKTKNNKKVYLVTFYASGCLPMQESESQERQITKEK